MQGLKMPLSSKLKILFGGKLYFSNKPCKLLKSGYLNFAEVCISPKVEFFR